MGVLLDLFRNVRELRGPVFVHAITVKGKGYERAEHDARKWHGVVPFDPSVGELAKAAGPVTYTQAFGDAMSEIAAEDPRVVAITAAMPDGTGLTGFAKAFPDRYYDTGIAEGHAVTFAAGMAAGGMRPYCAIYSTFLQRGFDQIVHDVALQHLPVRFFLDRSGLVGDDGPTHHGVFDLSYLSLIPGMVVMAPRDTTELREMVRWTDGYDRGPTAVRYPRGSSDDRLPEARTPIALGRAEVLHAEDRAELVILAIGSMVGPGWRAAMVLNERGIRTSVVNARFMKPLDAETILRVCRSAGRVITIEENVPSGGFGEAVRALLAGTSVQIESLTLPDAFVEHGAQAIIRAEVGLDTETIVSVGHRMCDTCKI
jgi:1-deoxy-D-xylulose-5-phosphate synthase